MNKKKMILAASVAGLLAVSGMGAANLAYAEDKKDAHACAGMAGCAGKSGEAKAKGDAKKAAKKAAKLAKAAEAKIS